MKAILERDLEEALKIIISDNNIKNLSLFELKKEAAYFTQFFKMTL